MDARPRELAVRMAHADEQIFTLPVEAARSKVREILRQPSKNGLSSVVENWRQLPDGQIEFAVRYFSAPE